MKEKTVGFGSLFGFRTRYIFRTLPEPADAESTLLEIKRLYNDRSLRITKKLFSQDGRPTKRVAARPKIIYHFTETGP